MQQKMERGGCHASFFVHINISSLLMYRAGLYVRQMYGGFLEKI